MTGLRIEGVSVTYAGSPPVAALRGVDLVVPDAGLTAVLGPSGCGKTTLLRVIAGLEHPGAGRVTMNDTVFDDAGRHLAPERRQIGLVPQDGALFPHLDVARNIAFGLRKLPAPERRERVEEMLALVELEGYGSRRPSQLSGGQQQRVALARALAPRPSLVLLDEPFSALDSGLRAEVRAEVTRLLRAAAITALVVTHDQTEALEMADTIAVLRAGSIVQVGPPTEVYHRPVDVWTGRFIGDAVVLAADVASGVAVCALGEVPLVGPVPHGKAQLLLRPEQVRPSDDPQAARGTVRGVRFRGADAAVDVEVGDGEVGGGALTLRWTEPDLPRVGESVGLRVVGAGVAFAD